MDLLGRGRMDITNSLAASRLVAQQRALDVTANNIANANTPGYRTERVQFSDWIDDKASTAAAPGGAGHIHSGSGDVSRVAGRDAEPYRQSVRSGGDGRRIFHGQHPNGPRLTRDGRFGPMPDGTLADSSGNAVLDTTGKPIQIADDRHAVYHRRGRIGFQRKRPDRQYRRRSAGRSAEDAGAKAPRISWRIRPTTPVTAPGIVQGAVEGSNVQPVLEVTRMMDNERQFQFVTQLVQAEGDRQQQTIDKLLPTGSGS